jgi:uncharacterized membrane protein
VSVHEHVRHHTRFYASLLLGVALSGAASKGGLLAPPLRLVAAGDGFFAVYLASSSFFAWRATPADLRRRASYEDEGMPLIILITLSAISLCVLSLIGLLAQPGAPGRASLLTAIASVGLGWCTLHTVAAFRYAHLYWAPSEVDPDDHTEGLLFPGTAEPGIWDFVYYSFVVGMTAQVSDVQVCSPGMRRTTLAHGVTSFFFNTVILALAVNIAAGLVH